jgi:hypothetical protein
MRPRTLPAIALTLVLHTPQAAAPAAPPSDPSASQPAPQSSAPVKPCRNPDAAGKYRIGCGVTAPQLIQKVDPDFPNVPKSVKLVTSIIVSLTVDAEGEPVDAHVTNSQVDKVDKFSRAFQQRYEDKLVDAVKQYKFKPATYQGKPVPVELNVEVNIDIF